MAQEGGFGEREEWQIGEVRAAVDPLEAGEGVGHEEVRVLRLDAECYARQSQVAVRRPADAAPAFLHN
jgi:predicted transcriptional regulator